ncbi:hypothetical protein OAH73_05600 [Planktomarina sp.]|nr:hypothetical protein [Planktomarina sp.]MDB4842025.1 hypothetical protein [Planktomarina sp.]
MSKKITISITVAAFLLSACDSAGKLGVEGSPAWWSRASASQKQQYVKPTCLDYGIKDGTPQMQQCIITEMRSLKGRLDDKMSSPSRAFCRGYPNSYRCS